MKDFIFQIPPKVEVGFSKSRDLAKIIKELELKRVLIVVDYNLKKMGIADPIFDSLKKGNVSFAIFDQIRNEPTIDEIDQAINDINVVSNFDGVVGIGGGSSIDVAKLLAVSGNIKGTVRNYIGTNLIANPGISMTILPTTSGTGAEATPNAIVKDTKEGWKKGIVSPYLIPDLVVLDPELTFALPPKITAETGIDAFTHAIECFIGKKANAMSDLFALDSMYLISKYLRRVFRDGSDKEARYYMALGSLYGGIAIANSGTGGVHALAYPLGGQFNMSHGLSNSLLLADVMEFNAEAVPDKFVEIAGVIGIETGKFSEKENIKSALDKIRRLVEDVGISKGYFKISKEMIDHLAKLAMSEQRLLQNNPRPIGFEDAKKIYQKVFIK
ncbi:MAG: iron-containing alcohol dehydrogenase [Tissierellales bacterium]|nr:iron-containing alcohol dehydrogenase [Tissierellales bacterium]